MTGTKGSGGRSKIGGERTQVQEVYDWTMVTPSSAIVEAIAALEDVDPVALATEEGMALYEYVDPEALDALVAGQQPADLALTLAIDGYIARIDGPELVVEPTENTE